MTRKIRAVATAVVVGALAFPASSLAHVTLQPSEVPAGGFTRLNVRVPNERDNAGTTKVAVQFPPGFYFVSYEPVPGWDVKVDKRKLAEPVEEGHGEEITEEVAKVTWTGTGNSIRPGQFRDFGLSVGVPEKPGEALTFKSLQTYENGEVVRWIGPPDADEPAPQVTLTAPEEEHAAPADDAAEEGEDEDEDDGNGLAIAALLVGGLGLVVGTGGFLRSRRR